MKLAPETRFLPIADSTVDAATRMVTFPFSSEAPVQRWYGNEVLVHDAESADLSRLNDGAPLLFNHGMNDIVGRVELVGRGRDRRACGWSCRDRA